MCAQSAVLNYFKQRPAPLGDNSHLNSEGIQILVWMLVLVGQEENVMLIAAVERRQGQGYLMNHRTGK